MIRKKINSKRYSRDNVIEYRTKHFFNHQMMRNIQNVSDIRAILASRKSISYRGQVQPSE